MQKQDAIALANQILAGEVSDPRHIAREILRESLAPQELQVLQILGTRELDTIAISAQIGIDARPLLNGLSNMGLVRSYVANTPRKAGGRRPNVWRVVEHVGMVQNESV